MIKLYYLYMILVFISFSFFMVLKKTVELRLRYGSKTAE